MKYTSFFLLFFLHEQRGNFSGVFILYTLHERSLISKKITALEKCL